MSFVQTIRSNKDGAGTFLAVAAYEGLSAPFVLSLYASQNEIDRRMDLEILSGHCHVDDSRNLLTRSFLESDCEQLVFLDADVLWSAPDLQRLIDRPEDIVAGSYPKKGDELEFPVKPFPGPRNSVNNGLCEVEGVATGFLKIRRRVLEALDKTVQHFRGPGDAFGRRDIPVIFERTLNGMSRRGGDYEFCRKAREAGFKVYVDPMMHMGHQGNQIWYGCLGHHWRKDVAIPEGLAAIRAGKETPEMFSEMYGAWNNNWALSPEALFTASRMARQEGGPILDCGAGLSSLCIAAATDAPVTALESSPVWAQRVSSIAKKNGLKNLTVEVCDIRDYGRFNWYDFAPSKYCFVVCDGPPQQNGRSGLFEIADLSAAKVLVDDITNKSHREYVQKWCLEHGRNLHIMEASRPFGVVT